MSFVGNTPNFSTLRWRAIAGCGVRPSRTCMFRGLAVAIKYPGSKYRHSWRVLFPQRNRSTQQGGAANAQGSPVYGARCKTKSPVHHQYRVNRGTTGRRFLTRPAQSICQPPRKRPPHNSSTSKNPIYSTRLRSHQIENHDTQRIV